MLKLGSPPAPAPHRASGLESKFRCTICCASPRRTGISAPALLSRERVSAGMSGLSGHYGDGLSGLILPWSCVRITPGLLRFGSVIFSVDGSSGGRRRCPRLSAGISARVYGSLLAWLNDHDSDVFCIGACNDASKLPPEFARAERFDGVLLVDLPGRDQKVAIWAISTRHYGLDSTRCGRGGGGREAGPDRRAAEDATSLPDRCEQPRGHGERADAGLGTALRGSVIGGR